MKAIINMAITANGYIAKGNDDTSFTSDIEWESYKNMAKKIGNIIVGKRTYQIGIKENSYECLEKIKIVVVSKDSNLKTEKPNHLVVHSPKEALGVLEKQGFTKAFVAGGGKLNASFLAENLIDEIYLDVEPTVFGHGIKLFEGKNFITKLRLLGTKKLSPNELQLHYQVLKS